MESNQRSVKDLMKESCESLLTKQSSVFNTSISQIYKKLDSKIEVPFPTEQTLFTIFVFIVGYILSNVFDTYINNPTKLDYVNIFVNFSLLLITIVFSQLLAYTIFYIAMHYISLDLTFITISFDLLFILTFFQNYSFLILLALNIKMIPLVWTILNLNVFLHKAALSFPEFAENKIFLLSDSSKAILKFNYSSELIKILVKFALGLFVLLDYISLLIIFYLLKELFIAVLRFVIQNKKMYEKIRANEQEVNILLKINQMVDVSQDSNLLFVCKRVFDELADADGRLKIEKLIEQIGRDDASLFFKFTDVDGNMSIDKDEFIEFYRRIIEERKNLAIGIENTNNSIYSLNFLLNAVFAFLVACVISSIIYKSNPYQTLSYFFFPLISGAYIFSGPINEIVYSFFFICCKRPFEIGQVVVLDGDVMIVHEISILSTVFEHNSVLSIVPNVILMKKPIENLSESRAYNFTMSLQFNSNRFEDCLDKLELGIHQYCEKYPSVFISVPTISKFSIVSYESISIDIDCEMLYEFIDFQDLMRRKNHFILELYRIFQEIGLHPESK